MKRIYGVVEAALLNQNSACCVLTSGFKGEGKTTMAAGIAVMAARQNDKKVLAMDFNWYAPKLHRFFERDLDFDLETLQSRPSVRQLIQSTRVDNLDILPAVMPSNGNAQGSESINTLVAELIDEARETYNFIVVDTAPMFPPNRNMIDPTFISKHADGVALITLANATPREHLKRAVKALETVSANIIGVIVNQWKNPMASA
jgi:Mrp family chromosome partitioning ATPase